VAAVIEREIQQRRAAAATYEAVGRAEESAALRAQVEVLVALS
jgi:uncharacterized protein YqeY